MEEEIKIVETENNVTMTCSLETFVQLFGLTLDEYREDYSSIQDLINHILKG